MFAEVVGTHLRVACRSYVPRRRHLASCLATCEQRGTKENKLPIPMWCGATVSCHPPGSDEAGNDGFFFLILRVSV